MNEVITGRHKICLDIAEAFGIKHCKSLEILMSVKEVVTVKTEFFPEIDGVKQLLPIIKKYRLVEKNDEN